MEQNTNKPNFVATREAAGSCPHCSYVMPRLVDCARKYFRDGFVSCNNCGKQVDLWQTVLDNTARLSIVPSWALASLGAGRTNIVMPIETGKYYQVELSSHGVPADAKILARNYTGQTGDVTAMEWHANTPPLRLPGTVLRLMGVPFGEGPLPRTGRVAIAVVWIRGDESDAWPYLTTAFEAAAAREYAPSMVFAQSAVEISMMPVIKQRLRRHAAADRVENFMKDSLTYSHALNVVLPYMSAELGAPKMPDEVRGALNKMRKKRNDIIHEGAKVAAVTPEDAMEGLCAAAFGFEYMRYVAPILLAEQSEAQNCDG
jgi:hypothetical protein